MDFPIPDRPPMPDEVPRTNDPRLLELVFWLARSPPLVRTILAASNVPENVSRVALVVGEDSTGPSVLVDREGNVDRCIRDEESVTQHRIRRAAYDPIVPRSPPPPPLPEGDPETALTLPWSRGAAFSRSDLKRARKWSAVLATQFARHLVATGARLVNLRVMRLPRWFKGEVREFLDEKRNMWSLAHAAGTYSVLTVADWTPPAVMPHPPLDMLLSHTTMPQGIVGPMMRAMWAVARATDPFLAHLDQRLAINDSESGLWAAVLGLGAVAALDDTRTDEVLDRVDVIVDEAPQEAKERLGWLKDGLAYGLDLWARDPEQLRYLGRMLADPILKGTLAEGHPLRPVERGTARDDLVVSLLATIPAAMFDPNTTSTFAKFLPLVVNAPAEHLFWTPDIGPVLTPPYNESFGGSVIKSWFEANGEVAPGTGVYSDLLFDDGDDDAEST